MSTRKKVLMNLMIFLLILTPINFNSVLRVEAAPDVSTDETGTELTTEEEKNFPDDYKVVTFATPTDGVGTPTDQLDIQLIDVYKVLVAILACFVCLIAWGVFRTAYRILTSQKI